MSDKGEVGYDEYSNGLAALPSTTPQRNWWWKHRQVIREAAAEFLGVMILIIFGTGVVCQITLSTDPNISPSPKGDYLSLNFAWACGAALGVWCSFGITGGHINPAVTLAFATWRGFPWKKVPYYIFAQLMGGLVGAAIVYGNYYHAINIFEGGPGVRTLATASLFSTYALDFLPNIACFFSEFLGTAMLVLVVMATVDKQNAAPPGNLFPLVIFLVILAIGASLGMETGYALNPARDLGPRLLTSMVGYGRQVYTFRNQYWLWCPVIAPILGAQFGAGFYDIFIYNGDDSIANKWGKPQVVTYETGRNV